MRTAVLFRRARRAVGVENLTGKRKGSMAKQIEYNSILTEREFTETDKFRRARKTRVLCDASGKAIGSVSEDGLFDLFGNEIAALKTEKYRPDKDGKQIRVADYASDKRVYRLAGDELYVVDGNATRFTGRILRKQRNVVKIALLGVLSAVLIAAIVLIALIHLPASDTEKPIIDIKDNEGTWEAQGVVAVFGDTVRPGSNGEYNFVINNPHDIEMQYSFYIEPKYDGDTDIKQFPIMFRLRMNNVLMETDEWKTVDKLKYDQTVILPNTRQSFTLEWQWPFESGSDDNDTLIGADGGKISLVLHLTAQAR